MTGQAYWTLYAEGHNRTRRIVAGVYVTRLDALDAAQRLWKQGLKPARISGPDGEAIETAEIDRYGQEHPEAAD